MFFKNKFEKALEQALKPGADFKSVLEPVGDYEITSKRDAKALCTAVTLLSERPDLLKKSDDQIMGGCARELAVFFQQAEGKEAYETLGHEGMPALQKLFDVMYALPDRDEDSILFILKIFSMYGSAGGADRIIKAARDGFNPTYMWQVILSPLGRPEHPHAQKIFRELSNPIPAGFIGVSLLDCANQYAIDGGEGLHPFDSVEGKQRLLSFLRDSDEEHFSYAHSATAALPFISDPERTQLLALAMDHLSSPVQLEAAWASAKVGSEKGVALLARKCLNVNTSSQAQRYLEELDKAHAIPEECKHPDFRATAEMSQWLQHPSEFGRPPEKLELIDTRKLFWPPTDDRRQVWLFKYEFASKDKDGEPDIGLGMVGSVTFALFGEATVNLTPIQAYALHCAWELEGRGDPRAPEKRSVAAGMAVLKKYNPDI